MAEIIWRDEWQLNDPAQINFNDDGSVTYKGPVGQVTLPEDFTAFLAKSNGAALRDRGSWFMGHFSEGVVIFEIEWLSDLSNSMFSTWGYYETDDEAQHRLPKDHVFIGYAEPGPSDVVMNVAKGDPDYGKVYVWTPSNDPWMTGGNTRGLGWVADSFTDFMNNLTQKAKL